MLNRTCLSTLILQALEEERSHAYDGACDSSCEVKAEGQLTTASSDRSILSSDIQSRESRQLVRKRGSVFI